MAGGMEMLLDTGGGSSGNSTSNTTSVDKRMVVDGQGIGVSSDKFHL